jgi:nucleoside-diphosphate-sugar epimerase
MPDFYGPFVINSFYEKFFINALKGKPLQWFGDLDAPIEFIFIDDGGKAMVAAGNSEKSIGESFNVPGYKETTAREFLNEIARQGNAGSKVKAINSEFVVGLAGIISDMAREFKEMMYLKQEKLVLDGTKFKNTFGELPATPYEEGIMKTLNWTKNYFEL